MGVFEAIMVLLAASFAMFKLGCALYWMRKMDRIKTTEALCWVILVVLLIK